MAALPSMTGITKLDVSSIEPADLASLLDKFPDLQELTLRCMLDTDDVELQQAAAAKQLTSLKVLCCYGLTPVGLHVLCQQLPKLCSVSCVDCPKLRQPDLDRCAGLLRLGTQQQVTFLEETRKWEDEEEEDDEEE